MKQSEVVAAVVGVEASIKWVPLGPGLEVMAWPVRVAGQFLAVSARTANACAIALSRDGWIVSLTTPKVEDMIFESAALRPEPVLISPKKVNIASELAIQEHSTKLSARLGAVSEDALVVAGKSWVLTNQLLKKPGRAANYGLYSASAPHRSATGAFRLWQPLSFAHGFDHWDYSQLLRLVRRRPGVALPSYDEPLRVFDLGGAPAASAQPSSPVASAVSSAVSSVGASSVSSVGASLDSAPDTEEAGGFGVAVGALGERCLAWCLEEWEAHRKPSAERIAWYHAVAKRNGKPLGIKVGNHCASAQSRAMIECLLPGEVAPHEPRAGAIELQQDAMANGRWHSRAEIQAGKWLPRPGDLAIYNRSNPADPKSTWWRHVDRVIRVVEDGSGYENIGANEVAGAWHREVTSFDSHKLLGFVEYPGSPPSSAEVAATQITLDDVAAG